MSFFLPPWCWSKFKPICHFPFPQRARSQSHAKICQSCFDGISNEGHCKPVTGICVFIRGDKLKCICMYFEQVLILMSTDHWTCVSFRGLGNDSNPSIVWWWKMYFLACSVQRWSFLFHINGLLESSLKPAFLLVQSINKSNVIC